jgi:hypothetical protein
MRKPLEGFSIAFTRETIRFGDGEPFISVELNPQQFEFKEVAHAIDRIVPPDLTTDVTERVEKGDMLAATAIVVVAIFVFMFREVAKGFLGAAGAELFKYLKKMWRKDDPQGPVEIQLHVFEAPHQPANLILVITPEVTPSEVSQIDIERLLSWSASFPGTQTANRTVGRLLPGPSVEIDFVVMPDGTVFHPDAVSRVPVGTKRHST